MSDDPTHEGPPDLSLAESEWRFRQLATNIKQVFWMAEPGEQILYVSPAYEEIWGRTCESLYADPSSWVEAILPEDREKAFDALARQGQAVETDVEYRIVRPDGSVRWIRDRGFPVSTAEGGKSIYTGLADDVTDLKDRERTMARARFTIDRAMDAIVWLDADGRVVDLNEALCQVLNRPREDLLGTTLFEHEPRLSEERWRTWWAQLKADGAACLEGKLRRKDGVVIPFEASVNFLLTQDGELCCAFARDVTERKKQESERRHFETKMRHAQKLESLGVLAGGIAHDFNNLLMGILGNAELALAEAPEDWGAREDLRHILLTAERATELTRQMLAYAGRSVMVTQAIDLSALVREMTTLLQSSVPRSVSLACEVDLRVPAVEADSGQIAQVVMNLVTNAAEAITEGTGVVTLRTGTAHLDADAIAGMTVTEGVAEGEFVFLEVVDPGHGMKPETVEKIFDPFFTTKFTGRGLGLAAVLGIVRGHRGTCHVDSAPGEGTRVRVFLPALERQAEVEPAEHRTPSANQVEGTVLLVDDDEEVRRTATLMLERIGLQVVAARDGQDAVEVFHERKGEFDLVLLDLTMPRMSGESAFRELRAIRPDVRVVMSSGYSEEDTYGRVGQDGVAGFIQKPYTIEELADVLARALDG